MKKFNYTKLLLSTIAVLALNACGNTNTNSNNKTSKPQVKTEINEDAPIITLQGDNPLYLQHGYRYNEPGATALDDVNGDVEVKASGEVDAFTIGTYYVTYTSKDFDGNVASVKRTVIVKPITYYSLRYKPLISPITGRIWLDRNTGASEVCTADNYIDFGFPCHGDIYQWGRNTDGHQKPNSQTTTKKGQNITDSSDKFVIGHDDWTSDIHRSANWMATDGHAVCPVHYRVPTIQEWEQETSGYGEEIYQFEHFLKLGSSTIRYSDGSLDNFAGHDLAGFGIELWSSTASTHKSYIFNLFSGSVLEYRSKGYPVRCIQD